MGPIGGGRVGRYGELASAPKGWLWLWVASVSQSAGANGYKDREMMVGGVGCRMYVCAGFTRTESM